MDTVELVMEIEEAFLLEIPSSIAEKIINVGELGRYVVDHSPRTKGRAVCLSAATFFTLRRAAAKCGSSKRLTPNDCTLAMIPRSDARQFWQDLGREAGLKLPELKLPPLLERIINGAQLLGSIGSGLACYLYTQAEWPSLAVMFVVGISLWILLHWLSCPWATVPPATLKHLTIQVMGENFQEMYRRKQGASEADLGNAIRALVARHTGVSLDRVRDNTEFVQDLGCD